MSKESQNLDRSEAALLKAVEAYLFVSGEPIELSEIASILELGEELCENLLEQLQERYRKQDGALEVIKRGTSYALVTKVELKDYLELFYQEPVKKPKLTTAAYETLAAVAYNQPVTRAQIEEIRGVNSDSPLQTLQERGLVEMSGTLDLPGRPALFSTTRHFLYVFGISDLSELEPLDMLMYDTIQSFEQAYRQQDKKISELAQEDDLDLDF